MNKVLKDKLRLLKVDLLRFLLTLSLSKSISLDLNEISQSTNTSESVLSGIIGTLRRLKIDGESIIQPAGRDENGRLRWQIDESVVSKKELAEFLENEILGKEGLSWQK